MTNKIVSVSYSDLLSDKDLTNTIKQAYGQNGLGIILITDYPNLGDKKNKLLTLSQIFANLPEKTKEKYVHAESNFSFGWSHGKEKMKGGVPDIAKGSYYANPIYDSITDDDKLKKEYPGTYGNNIWPKDILPEFEFAFKELGQIQLNIGLSVCNHLDKYLQKISDNIHKENTFYNMIKKSKTYKGRLLHYFPREKKYNCQQDGLCGWHLDHGSITVLPSPLFLDLNGNKIKKPDECGLYIKSRNGDVVKVDIPENCFGVQLGEMFQLLSGGHLRATPHCVRSCINSKITREQFAMFLDCFPDQPLILPDFSLPYKNVVNTPFLPEGVPTLESRLKNVKVYRDFVNNTINAYYNS